MGLRQPSKTAVFFAQAKAGAEGQKKARDQLKTPQALGGSAGVGTAMIASTTGAQKAATGQVQAAGESAAKDLTIKPENIGSSAVTAIAGTPTTAPTGGQPAPSQIKGATTSADFNTESKNITDKISKIDIDLRDIEDQLSGSKTKDMFGRKIIPSGQALTDLLAKQSQLLNDRNNLNTSLNALSAEAGTIDITKLAESGDLSGLELAGTALSTAIDNITKDISNLDNLLETASDEDAKLIAAEKTRLNNLLQQYQDKITKENLGQIAGPSDTEINMLDREQLLASEGQRVAKLASIFGPGWNAKRYGGLASQIYGKDLESIQESASAGLEASKRAAREADVTQEQYKKQLKTSQAEYEKGIKTEENKLEILKKTPSELKTTTKDELIKIFGNEELVNKLFKFDNNNKVIDTTASSTRKSLEDRLTKLKETQGGLGDATTRAKRVVTKQLTDEFTPVDEYGNPIKNKTSTLYDAKSKFNLIDRSQDDKNTFARLEGELTNAINNADRKEANRIMGLINNLAYESVKEWQKPKTSNDDRDHTGRRRRSDDGNIR